MIIGTECLSLQGIIQGGDKENKIKEVRSPLVLSTGE